MTLVPRSHVFQPAASSRPQARCQQVGEALAAGSGRRQGFGVDLQAVPGSW
jgi:hypothetical protein